MTKIGEIFLDKTDGELYRVKAEWGSVFRLEREDGHRYVLASEKLLKEHFKSVTETNKKRKKN